MGVIVARLNEDFYNHGAQGLKTKLENYLAIQGEREKAVLQAKADEATKKEEDDRKTMTFRWIVGIVLTIIMLLMGLYNLLEANKQFHLGLLKIQQKSLSDSHERVLAGFKNQSADMPQAFTALMRR